MARQTVVHSREPYVAPEVEVLEVKSEGIVCASGGTEQYGGPSGGYGNGDFS